jgi:uncharacterized protein YqgC (DUF456 family)
MSLTAVLAAIMVVVGVIGVVVPALPGLLLVWAGVLLWALGRHDPVAWTTLGVLTAVTLAGVLAKYAWPGRRLRSSGVPWRTLAAGAALAAVGFFVIPVVGAVLGLLLGIYLAELARLGSPAQAWPSTRATMAAVGWGLAIELGTALVVATGWAATAALA